MTDTQTAKAMLHIMSWNVNGLLDNVKRTAALRYCQHHMVDLLLFQETHLVGHHCSFLARYGFSEVWHAGFSRGSRGVAILARRGLPLVVRHATRDPHGRFIILEGSLGDQPLNLISVYSPPFSIDIHTPAVRYRGGLLASGTTVVGGDFSAIMDPTLDTTGPPSASRTTHSVLLSNWAAA